MQWSVMVHMLHCATSCRSWPTNWWSFAKFIRMTQSGYVLSSSPHLKQKPFYVPGKHGTSVMSLQQLSNPKHPWSQKQFPTPQSLPVQHEVKPAETQDATEKNQHGIYYEQHWIYAMIDIGFIHGERKETSSWKSSQPSNHTHFANKWKAGHE